MARTGTNFGAVAGFNVAVVLDAIRRRPQGVARGDLAAITGLSGMTVSNVCRRLIDSGLVTQSYLPATGRGKPPGVLHLNPGGGYSVGVHIDPAEVTYVVIDLAGVVRGHTNVRTPLVQDPNAVVGEMAETVDTLLLDAGIDKRKVLGVGIASPGPINAEAGVVLDPPMLPNWHRVELRRSLSAAIGLPVVLEKDCTAAVVAELWYAGTDGSRDFAFVYYGTGFAMGVATGGDVLRGVSANAGDAGHVMVDPHGPVCRCGRRGCVGDMTVPKALVERAVREGVLDAEVVGDTGDVLAVGSAFMALTDLAAAGERAARAIIADAARALARAVVVTANFLDFGEVVFGGPFWGRIAPIVLAVLPDAVHRDPALVVPHRIRFVESRIPVDVPAVGAATLLMDSSFSARPDSLLLRA